MIGSVYASTEAAGAASAHKGEGQAKLPVASFVNFALLVGVIVWAARKPIRKLVGDRHDQIKTALAEAEAAKIAAQEMMRNFEKKLAGLDKEVALLLEDARVEGERERQRIIERANRAAEKIKEDARLAAEKESDRMRRELKGETLSQAATAATEQLRKRITPGDHDRLIGELISQLEQSDGQRF